MNHVNRMNEKTLVPRINEVLRDLLKSLYSLISTLPFSLISILSLDKMLGALLLFYIYSMNEDCNWIQRMLSTSFFLLQMNFMSIIKTQIYLEWKRNMNEIKLTLNCLNWHKIVISYWNHWSHQPEEEDANWLVWQHVDGLHSYPCLCSPHINFHNCGNGQVPCSSKKTNSSNTMLSSTLPTFWTKPA